MFLPASIITAPSGSPIISAISYNSYAPGSKIIDSEALLIITANRFSNCISALLNIIIDYSFVILITESKTDNPIKPNFEVMSTGSLKLNPSVDFTILKLSVCSIYVHL